jgi:uncharacterized cupredoxin-like copper-binding protein
MERQRSNYRQDRIAGFGIATAMLVVLAFSMNFAPALPARPASGVSALVVHPSVETVYLNVSATELSTFLPDQLSAPAGALVHLKVTQLADFDHTFLLSPVVNFTFPTTDTTSDLVAFFATHTPLVNFSLGSTPGASFFANFTAPAVGTYEFVCQLPGHFAGGMHGTLSTTGSGSSSTPPASMAISTTVIVIVIIVVLAIIALVAMLAMRRRRTPPATGSPPPSA